ncbi:histidinol-phosphate transaminase [Christiangramia forsetii]|uniref:Histidinol-phosphate aminotransferase n=2 Tax=Christiangramia forsetii TaxID=411153 RepID=HIS8_CHRFK|nr:histidinol-phosphate transaminase [Christiangramia forsetii]A0M287.1 RecName: Full=Histidinol-phosphate aminotransferase; AltName: Full=Imidazole acetol-phosphate transaminase [Christiangramia forsetii KT0803]GGG39794.1 histidinol-phosphate aminotransferase [Christiangramia forsetii]CAL66732.1 histidinol-phosphate aminotransferase [Christiangramia forsetii KT0803]
MKDFNINKLVRPNVAGLKPYSSARDEFKTQGAEMVFLDANENPNDNGLNRYPDPQQTSVKEKLSETRGVSPNNILLGNGSDEVLDLIFRAFCEPGKDNVITLPPTYGMYKVLSDINNIENREVLLNHDFEPDLTAIFKQITKDTKIIFLCSPNNPSGNSFEAEKIEMILEKFNGLVVIDEAYIDFSDSKSWIHRLEDFPNLIVTQTFSKAFGRAGIRLGVLYSSDEIIAILNKIKPPYNVNQLTQKESLKILFNLDSIKLQVAEIKNERTILSKQLLEVNFVSKIYRSDANFLLIEVDHANKRYDQFLEKGIVIRNRSNQPLCENCLRITIGTKEENKKLIKAFKELENE